MPDVSTVLKKVIAPVLAQQSNIPDCFWYASHGMCEKDINNLNCEVGTTDAGE